MDQQVSAKKPGHSAPESGHFGVPRKWVLSRVRRFRDQRPAQLGYVVSRRQPSQYTLPNRGPTVSWHVARRDKLTQFGCRNQDIPVWMLEQNRIHFRLRQLVDGFVQSGNAGVN